MKNLETRKQLMKKYLTHLSIAIGIAVFAGCAQGEPSAVSTISTENQPGVPGGWVTDYDAALKLAKAENKSIFLLFTGSDWCPPCMQFEEKILSTETFEKYAKENLVLVYMDFPRISKEQTPELREQNETIAKQYGISGFPIFFILSPEGQPLVYSGYQEAPVEAFIEAINSIVHPDESVSQPTKATEHKSDSDHA